MEPDPEITWMLALSERNIKITVNNIKESSEKGGQYVWTDRDFQQREAMKE